LGRRSGKSATNRLSCGTALLLIILLIISRHGRRRKHRSSVAVQVLVNSGMTYSIVACAAIGTDRAGNTILLLLFSGHCLATAVVELYRNGSTCHNIYKCNLHEKKETLEKFNFMAYRRA
jgi:hypothetical protein